GDVVVGNNIKLKWLRQNCGVAPQAGATDEELDRYTRAVALELFGTLMFPDISQNSVPTYYLELVS
ncbi:Serine/threonine protein phosphatase 7 long form isogeny, partial [Rhynchospora pubera]